MKAPGGEAINTFQCRLDGNGANAIAMIPDGE